MNHPEDVFRKTIIETVRNALNEVGHPCHIAILADICHCEQTKRFIQKGSDKTYGFNMTVLSIGDQAARDFKIDGYWLEFSARVHGADHHFKLNIGSIYQISSPTYSGYTLAMPDTYLPDELMDPKDLADLEGVRRDLLGTQQDESYGESNKPLIKGPPKLSVVKP